MGINLQLPMKEDVLKPTITVCGVGGAGGNAVNNMIASALEGVNFVVANTDAQALDNSLAQRTIQLGAGITRGLGAGASPDIGGAAAEEAMDEIAANIEGSNMLFITAGMGGGTGTGAAPVVARIARDQGILTVAVVTKPFQFEGTHRMKLAEAGLEELQSYVDTLIIIPNQNLFRIANERTTFADAFKMADEVLHSGVRGVTDLMVKPGLINLDFADIRTVMREMGKAMMGTGEASGDRRAIEAAESAISNPLLDEVSLKGARAALINITGGPDMTLFEVDEAANRIREEVDSEANIIFGSAFNDAMEGTIRVSVVATGIEQRGEAYEPRTQTNPIEQKKPYLFNQGSKPSASESVKPTPKPAVAEKTTQEEEPIVASKANTPVKREPATAVTTSRPVRTSIGSAAAALQEEDEEELAVVNKEKEVVKPTSVKEAQEAIPSLSLSSARPLEEGEVRPISRHEARTSAAYNPEKTRRPDSSANMQGGEDGGAKKLLKRLANVSRPFASRDEEGVPSSVVESKPVASRKPVAQEKPRAEVVKSSNPVDQDEEFLDIPAFLRRQAN